MRKRGRRSKERINKTQSPTKKIQNKEEVEKEKKRKEYIGVWYAEEDRRMDGGEDNCGNEISFSYRILCNEDRRVQCMFTSSR